MSSVSQHRSAFLAAAAERGYIHQCTDFAALDERLSAGPLVAYVGYDCTADSLHIGNLMSIMLLRLFQQTGNKPIVLMGGGTTRIGDPSGRTNPASCSMTRRSPATWPASARCLPNSSASATARPTPSW
jgi:tyrosyl-tRNA synthetase